MEGIMRIEGRELKKYGLKKQFFFIEFGIISKKGSIFTR
jgi:hypothetical protein